MYYEVYLDFYFFRKFFNGCGSAYPGKNGDAGKMEGKTYCRHSRAGKHVVLYRIAASLSGEFYSDLFLDRFRFTSGKGRTWKKNGKRSALWCIVAWNFKLLLLAVHCMWQKRSDIFREFL